MLAGTYPDLAPVSKPNPEPALPSHFDAYAPPVGMAPVAGAPVFAEWMRQAGPGDTMVATGQGLGAFTAFTQARGAGHLSQPQAVYQGSHQSQLTLDPAMPAGGMVLLWSSNASGYGRPAAVNRTEAWWLEELALPGQAASVFGRNFHYGGVTPAVYVVQAGLGSYAQLSSWNNYRIEYQVPSGLAINQSAQVWVHNGHGGSYGWSGPLTLQVKASPNNASFWSGQTFNVKNYGAKGDGITDDGAAIRAALSAAAQTASSAPATVHLPAGTYMTTLGFNNLARVRWKGDGKALTTIKLAPGFSDQALFYESTGMAGHGDDVEIRDMTLDINNNLRNANAFANGYKLILQTGVNRFKLANLRIYSGMSVSGAQAGHGETIIFKGAVPGNHAWMENCDIYGGQCAFHAQGQVFVKDCNFYGQYDAGTFASIIGGIGFSMTGCRAQDFNAAADPLPSPNPNFADGRIFVAGGREGSRNTYIAGNTTVNFAPRESPSHSSNSGEQVLWESGRGLFNGKPSSATGNGLSIPQSPTSYGPDPGSKRAYHYAVVLAGKGMGQRRLVTADNGSGGLGISPDWNVIPDGGSLVQVQTLNEHAAVYQNLLEGKANYATYNSASAGIQPYGNTFDIVAEGNTIRRVRHGLFVWSLQDNDVALSPTQFCLFQNNTVYDCLTGGRAFHENFGFNQLEGTALLATAFRRNQLPNTAPGMMQDSFKVNIIEATTQADRITSTLIDNNSGGYLPSVGALGPTDSRVTHTLISGNSFLTGPAPTPTPRDSSPKPSLTPTPPPMSSPTATSSRTPTRTATRSATPTPTRTATASATPSRTPSRTPTPVPPGKTLTFSATSTPTTAAFASGEPKGLAEGQHLLAGPNPNPTALYVKLQGFSDAITLRLYSPSLALVQETRIPGAFGPGWNKAPLPADFGQGLANGVYFLNLVSLREGLMADRPRPYLIYLLK